MSVVVVATITPKPGEEDAVREAVLAAIPQVHEEPGCELYALHEGAGEFVMVERWESAEALAVHSKAEALTRLGSALAGKVSGPPNVRTLTAVPGGDAAKGRL
ncbi:putative quinol monooxygenase [Petropleomorpha daqingensis]|uniref:Quinol monooxygenase YgiN n=1 Tax=Petropleomorpha daqingensis TaxID=2026353 RepID=A0A853CIT6_9ACTN|nr:quinol monooxygenase YgiN [Petropleomorpha daqingensis]